MLAEFQFINSDINHITLTAKGYERCDEALHRAVASNQAFVALWFDPSMKAIYDEAIDPAIRAAGYEPMRIDRKEHLNKVDDEIIAEIRRSRFLVADFTCGRAKDGQAIVRGGVYFEAGFAQGLGIPVVWTRRQDCIGDVHFDTRQFPHIVWTGLDDLRKQLRDRIVAVIGEGPNIHRR